MTFKRKYDPRYKSFRSAVVKRDKYTCQMCGKKRCKLNVHHIHKYADHPYIRFDPNNGITLCIDCHRSIRNKEKYYAGLFAEKVYRNTKAMSNKKSKKRKKDDFDR